MRRMFYIKCTPLAPLAMQCLQTIPLSKKIILASVDLWPPEIKS
jgi:hypothetical protein